MASGQLDFENTCRLHLNHFFTQYRDPVMEKSAMKVLRFLMAGGELMRGKPEGWAAGIIYALANRGKRPCGVPGFLNAQFEQFLGVSMSTVRKRAAQVGREIEI